jgi:glyoxylase-like metal-dependent hydrolase (beta-lactamase superfamily II)
MSPSRSSQRLAAVLVSLIVLAHPSGAVGQDNPYTPALLTTIRREAQALPGPRPRDLRYLVVAEAQLRLDMVVADASPDPVTIVFPVFQIRFADRWIMVDAALDSAAMVQTYGRGAGVVHSGVRYDSVQTALRGAETVVLTHEHLDHAIGVQRGPHFRQIASRTALTKAQLQSLLNPPARAFFPLSPDSASLFRVIDYPLVHALAPGVVLIRAPGHSPGSQFVYVRLADDREVLLVGDLVWMMPGLTMNRQKPQSASDGIKEDRGAIQRELDWVRSLLDAGVIAVTPSHDKSALDALVAKGVLRVGLDLRRN